MDNGGVDVATKIKEFIPTKQNALIGVIFLIGLMGLANSFDALTSLALDSEFTNSLFLARVFAAMIDLFIIVLGAEWLWASLNNESEKWYMVLMIVWTVISLVLNILHAPSTWVAWFIASLSPITIFFAFHTGWDILKKISQRNKTITSTSQLKTEREQLLTEVDQLKTEREQLPKNTDQLKTEREQLLTEVDQLKTEREQLPRITKQLKTQKANLDKFFNNLVSSKAKLKQNRLKRLIPIIAEFANLTEQYTKRDIETIRKKLETTNDQKGNNNG